MESRSQKVTKATTHERHLECTSYNVHKHQKTDVCLVNVGAQASIFLQSVRPRNVRKRS